MKISGLSIILLLIFLISSCTDENAVKVEQVGEKTEPSLELVWTTDSTLLTCESVLYDKEREILYVSNINGNPEEKDNNGFISKVKTDGTIEVLNWVTGLHAPKGMGITEGKLYVTDITALVEIDISTGKILKSYEIPGARFLNDIATDEDGRVYFSDSYTNKIHVFKDGKAEVWKEGFDQPNGLLVLDGMLYLASMGSSDFRSINLETKEESVIATGLGAGDGVICTAEKGCFTVSNWKGEVFFITPEGNTIKMLDTKDIGLHCADIEYIEAQNLLLVPTFAGNHVAAYRLK